MSDQRVVIFEDDGWRDFYPITLSRPVFDCRVGGGTLARRLMSRLVDFDLKHAELICRQRVRTQAEREYQGHPVNTNRSADTIFINGRVLCLGDSLAGLLEILERPLCITGPEGTVLAARLTGSAAAAYRRELLEALHQGLPAPIPVQAEAEPPKDLRLAGSLADLVTWNTDAIEDDYEWSTGRGDSVEPEVARGATVLGKKNIFCRPGVTIEPGAVLDARNGPIVLGEYVRVQHQAAVLGPAFLGAYTQVNMAARVYDAVAAGPNCKLGGEIEASTIQSFSNKQHDGFLGHSYLGAWINLGAGTNNSDLKNNYGSVRVWSPRGDQDTGLTFAGVYIGDHTKTAIGTQLNTGTVVGMFCNIYGGGPVPQHLPSFSWCAGGIIESYRVEKAVEVARIVMSRRGVALEPADEVLLEAVAESELGMVD